MDERLARLRAIIKAYSDRSEALREAMARAVRDAAEPRTDVFSIVVEGNEATWEQFIKALPKAQSELLLEGSLIVDGLESWLKNGSNHGRRVYSRELYDDLTGLLFQDKRPPRDWPRSTVKFGQDLARIRRELRTLFQVEWDKDRRNRVRYEFRPKEDEGA